MAPWILLALTLLIQLAVVYFFIKLLRGNSREQARKDQLHEHQVSELLDRLAHAQGQPWTLPPRPVEDTKEITEEERQALLERLNWREV